MSEHVVTTQAEYDKANPQTGDTVYLDSDNEFEITDETQRLLLVVREEYKPSISTYGTSVPSISTCDTSEPSISTYDTSKPSISTYDTSKPSISTYGTSVPSISTYDTSKPSISTYDTSKPSIEDYRAKAEPETVSEVELTEGANEHERLARRHAAELLDAMGTPSSYDEAVTIIAVAYLDGGRDQLKWARDLVRGDGA